MARVRAVFIAAVLITGASAAAGDQIGERGGCVFCQAGDVVEDEPDCGVPIDTTNGGCDLDPPLFTPILCGQTICGNSAVLVIPPDPNFDPNEPNSPGGEQQFSDQDWYQFEVTAPNTRVLARIESNFVASISIISACGNQPVLAGGVEGCLAEARIDGCLPPGIYYVGIVHSFGIELGCGANYRLTLDCSPCSAPANDLCVDAIDLAAGIAAIGQTVSATIDPISPCDVQVTTPGVWYRVVGSGNELIASTCDSRTNFDTKVQVFCGTDCGDLVCVRGDDDDPNCGEPGFFPPVYRSTVKWCSEVDRTYWILVSGASGDRGDFALTVYDFGFGCGEPALCERPANDECENAELAVVPSTISGNTRRALIDPLPTCGTSITASGVWYKLIGDGNTFTATSCGSSTEYDIKLNVFCGDCGSLTCITGRDDSCGRQVEISWCTQIGAEYLLLVQGYDGQSGDFEVFLNTNGASCTPTVVCADSGACCANSGCLITTRPNCANIGGSFRGTGSACDGLQYVVSENAGAFEDITIGGTLSSTSNCDDCGESVPLPFAFPFYFNAYNSVGVSSNGFLQFGTSTNLTARNNVAIPTSSVPNNMICALWDDLNPNQGLGEVRFASRSNPSRFIVQWTNVPQHNLLDSNTFQVVLFATGDIELRYAAIGNFAGGDTTTGIEDDAGLSGVNILPSTIGSGNTSLRLDRSLVTEPCACADITGDGQVGLSDLATLLTNFGLPSGASRSQGDLNADGDVDLSDLATMLGQFGSQC